MSESYFLGMGLGQGPVNRMSKMERDALLGVYTGVRGHTSSLGPKARQEGPKFP